jgi:glycosyltransferase involved in cell wall biosynthesis
MDRVLIITYYWPPSGGAGVQRWLKLSKYLPQYGWQPVVLTVDPDYASYPAIDKTLVSEIPESIRVERTKATNWFSLYGKTRVPSAGFAKNNDDKLSGKISRFIRGNFFIPDPRRGWNRHAFRRACEIIKNEGIKTIITTSPPHSTQLIGKKLRKRFPGIRWIADLRDPWTDIYYYDKFYPTFISRAIDAHYEKSVLHDADRIITVGPTLKKIFASKLVGVESKTEVIFNGFDADDFSGISPVVPEVLTISYTGTLSASYPIQGFLKALMILRNEEQNFRLRFTGEVPPDQRNEIESVSGSENAEFNNYAEHKSAIRNMLNSSVLLLIIPDHESSRTILTGKLFEYLSAGIPILCLGPCDGDAAAIISKAGAGETFNYNDVQGISAFLKNTMKLFSPDLDYINSFSRSRLAEKTAKILSD